MQENKPYIKGKHRKILIIKWKRIVIATFLLCIGICIMVCVAAQGEKYITLDEQHFYFVQMGEYTAEQDATAKSLQVKAGGGAGYIFSATTSKVMASVYYSNQDALKVCSRLNQDGQNAEVFAISSPKIKIKAQNSSAENLEISSAINYPLTVFKRLYNTALNLDKSQISESLALKDSQTLVAQTDALIQKYSTSKTIELKAIKDLYIKINTTLTPATTPPKTNTSSSVSPLSTKLKYVLCELAVVIIDGYKSI